jgi:hypothetical protein
MELMCNILEFQKATLSGKKTAKLRLSGKPEEIARAKSSVEHTMMCAG